MRLKQAASARVSSPSSVPVYDAGTVRATIARAAEIEARAAQPEDVPLTAARIEALGQQLGLSPTRVREALGEVVGRQRRQRVVKAVVPGLVYGVVLFVLFTGFGAQFTRPFPPPFFQNLHLLFLTYLPPLLVLVVGWYRRDYRLGALAGLVVTVAGGVGFASGTMVSTLAQPEQTQAAKNILDGSIDSPVVSYVNAYVIPLMLTTLYVAVPLMLLGALGGACGRAWQTRLARSNR